MRERVERIGGEMMMMTETLEARFQTQTVARTQEFSRIKEVVSGWSGVRQYLRGDEARSYPSSYRRTAGATAGCSCSVWRSTCWASRSSRERGARRPGRAGRGLPRPRLLWLWRGAIVEIEQGTTGVRSRYGEDEHPLAGKALPLAAVGQVEFVVDTATEIHSRR